MSKVVYITGGSKGIGLGIAKALLVEGHKVAITSSSKDAITVAQEMNALHPGNIIGLQSDVRSSEDEQAAIQNILAQWGRVDVLIANAGVGVFKAIDELELDEWQRVVDVNLTGVFNSLKASIPSLKESKGYFISIASLAGTNFFAQGTAYNASKFGLVGFTQAAMLDLRKYDIKATTIMPGSVATYFNGHTPSDQDAWKIQPEDIGDMVVSLLNMHPRTLPSKVEVRPSRPPGS